MRESTDKRLRQRQTDKQKEIILHIAALLRVTKGEDQEFLLRLYKKFSAESKHE